MIRPVPVTPALWLSIAYAVSCSSLYLWGYWGQFGINILEFMSVADIAKAAAPALALVLAAVLYVTVAVDWIVGLVAGRRKDEATASHSRADIVRWSVRLTLAAILGLYFIFQVATYALEEPVRAAINGLLLVFLYFASTTLRSVPMAERLVPHETARAVLAFALLAVPLFSYAWGADRGIDVRSGQGGLWLVAANVNPNYAEFLGDGFIGRAGGYLFFIDVPTGAVGMVREEDDTKVHLARRPTP